MVTGGEGTFVESYEDADDDNYCDFLIFNVLSILLFTYYAKAEGDNSAVAYAKQSMQEIVNEKSELIAIKFDRLETSVDLLSSIMEEVLQEEKNR